MRTSVLLMLAALLSVSVSVAETIIPPGPVSGLWTQAGSPYRIQGDISVQIGDELTIEPGCLVIFGGHYELRVHGRLVAVGTETDNITFAPDIPSVGWHGIRFFNTTTNNQDASTLAYCVLRNGRAVGSIAEEKDGGAIYCTASSDVLLTHCVFHDNYADDEGGALYLGNGSDVRVEDSEFLNNGAYFSGGAIHCDHSSPIVVNTILDTNTSTVFAGGIAGWNAANFRLVNVRILNCQAGAVCGFYSVASHPVLVGCLIAGNTSSLGAGGGGGLTSASGARLINTTIADNTAAQAGGGVWVYGSSAEVVNSVVWGNQPDALAVLSGGTAAVSYSDVSGGWTGVGNLNLPPVFVGSGPDPFALGELSPCIDVANPDTTGLGLPELDLAGHPRIVNGRVDMGGYEYMGAGGIAAPAVALLHTPVARCAPNPFQVTTTLTYELPMPARVTLRICDVEGRQVRRLRNGGCQDSRPYQILWDGRNDAGELMPSGTYVFTLTAGAQQVTRKVTLLR